MNQSLKTILIGIASGFAGAYLFDWSGLGQRAQIQTQSNVDTAQAIRFADYRSLISQSEPFSVVQGFTEAAKASTECVVYIKTTTLNQRSYTFFDLFFDTQPRYDRVMGSGSGVIFSKDGYIVTNNHVIAGATEISVVHNKRTYKAKVIGTDPSTDLALLKIDAQNLPAIRIASSETVQVGDWVLAVGNPFNLTSTVTAGIVSAKGRNINILENAPFPIESFIQTDAAINPGNSGGALVNMRGELVGINTAILSRTGSYAGYGFAVPSDIVVKVVTDLKNYGQVQKAFLGVDVIDVTEEVYRDLNLDEISGVVITYIEPKGAAERAGLKRGDVIVSINGKPIDSKVSFDEQLSYYKPGDKVNVRFKREGKINERQVELTNIDGTTSIFRREVYKAERIGAELELVPKAERTRLGIETGVRISKITGGLMQQMGIEEGFIIVSINERPIQSPEELAEILERIRGRVIIKGIAKNGTKGYYSYIF
ncbi:MAG: trypsin-like peptidase domain-containing protein [Cytophagales bacterium]|nr:trypsin-like peptidase domain-containing protein [Bernardetiaceae bacterium]MDW8204472.1 trypsin-like peptidase domain-containing protein [Cytophagales bacterium]